MNTGHAPELLRLRDASAVPMSGAVLWVLLVLTAALLLWSALAQLDIVAVADGKLVPSGYVKIVQPAEQGMVREILVREGEFVSKGQVLARMDAVLSAADRSALAAEFNHRRLALRRIEAQLAGASLKRMEGDPPEAYARAAAQLEANVRSHAWQLAQEQSLIEKAGHELHAARTASVKLSSVLPHYREQEAAFEKLVSSGFSGRLMYTDKQRERIEKEQDLAMQEAIIAASQATLTQARARLAQLETEYRRGLAAERTELSAQLERSGQELAKIEHRHGLLELKAPQDGVVKDLATHTPGTVVAPGAVLMTLVPTGDRLRAEVWVSNQDAGFVRPGLPVKVKLLAYPFTRYGMLDGRVAQLSADATEAPSANTRSDALGGRDRPMGPLSFRALVDLETQVLVHAERELAAAPGMQVVAEIALGRRSVLDYLLSPVQKAWHDAGRER